eukprot:6567478-Prymnesium_polylepis.1
MHSELQHRGRREARRRAVEPSVPSREHRAGSAGGDCKRFENLVVRWGMIRGHDAAMGTATAVNCTGVNGTPRTKVQLGLDQMCLLRIADRHGSRHGYRAPLQLLIELLSGGQIEDVMAHWTVKVP